MKPLTLIRDKAILEEDIDRDLLTPRYTVEMVKYIEEGSGAQGLHPKVAFGCRFSCNGQERSRPVLCDQWCSNLYLLPTLAAIYRFGLPKRLWWHRHIQCSRQEPQHCCSWRI